MATPDLGPRRMGDARQPTAAEIREMFDLIDLDHGGTIDLEELHEFFKSIRLPASVEDVERIVKEVDADKSGDIDIDEFEVALLKKTFPRDYIESVRGAFHLMKKKYMPVAHTPPKHIKGSALAAFLVQYGGISPDEAEKLLFAIDVKPDDMFNFEQFLDIASD